MAGPTLPPQPGAIGRAMVAEVGPKSKKTSKKEGKKERAELEPAAHEQGEQRVAADGEERSKRSCLHRQLRKTKFCLYHLQGVCHFGDKCAYAHSCDELQGSPDLRRTRLCNSFPDRDCTDPDCTFAHSQEELRSTDMFYKKTLCIWFEKGRCRNGDQCRFAHSQHELRQHQAMMAAQRAGHEPLPYEPLKGDGAKAPKGRQRLDGEYNREDNTVATYSGQNEVGAAYNIGHRGSGRPRNNMFELPIGAVNVARRPPAAGYDDAFEEPMFVNLSGPGGRHQPKTAWEAHPDRAEACYLDHVGHQRPGYGHDPKAPSPQMMYRTGARYVDSVGPRDPDYAEDTYHNDPAAPPLYIMDRAEAARYMGHGEARYLGHMGRSVDHAESHYYADSATACLERRLAQLRQATMALSAAGSRGGAFPGPSGDFDATGRWREWQVERPRAPVPNEVVIQSDLEKLTQNIEALSEQLSRFEIAMDHQHL